jgi:puromycin-sensitive aminopeptidase
MDSWIWQPGYPLVSARLDGTELVLQQQRFAYGDTDDATLFVVPVHVAIDGIQHKVLFDTDEDPIPPRPDAVAVPAPTKEHIVAWTLIEPDRA